MVVISYIIHDYRKMFCYKLSKQFSHLNVFYVIYNLYFYYNFEKIIMMMVFHFLNQLKSQYSQYQLLIIVIWLMCFQNDTKYLHLMFAETIASVLFSTKQLPDTCKCVLEYKHIITSCFVFTTNNILLFL